MPMELSHLIQLTFLDKSPLCQLGTYHKTLQNIWDVISA